MASWAGVTWTVIPVYGVGGVADQLEQHEFQQSGIQAHRQGSRHQFGREPHISPELLPHDVIAPAHNRVQVKDHTRAFFAKGLGRHVPREPGHPPDAPLHPREVLSDPLAERLAAELLQAEPHDHHQVGQLMPCICAKAAGMVYILPVPSSRSTTSSNSNNLNGLCRNAT